MLLVLALVVGMLPLGVLSVYAAANIEIELTSQEILWVDANKCSAEGPRGAWLSFVIKNTGDEDLTDVVVTFAGFTGTNASFFVTPSDLTRTFSTIAAGSQEPVYYYVDYSEVCNNPAGGGTPYDGYTADYTLTVASNELADAVYNGAVVTDELLTASAAGIALTSVLGPGVYVGQLLTQTVEYEFGNNTDLFFQPGGEAGFDDACLRLVGSEITAVTGTVDTALIGQKDRLHFPDADVAGGGGTISVTYTWEVLCVNAEETLHPWAAAKSGNKYKYTGFAASQIVPAATEEIDISKSVDPTYLETPTSDGGYGAGIVKYSVVLSNTALVPLVVSQITDVLPACMVMVDSTASGSEVTSGNSTSVPSAGATGTVTWVGKSLG
ncbi:MAG: hypothetical protein PVI80_22450, partial [Anaerolineae bacterium]